MEGSATITFVGDSHRHYVGAAQFENKRRKQILKVYCRASSKYDYFIVTRHRDQWWFKSDGWYFYYENGGAELYMGHWVSIRFDVSSSRVNALGVLLPRDLAVLLCQFLN